MLDGKWGKELGHGRASAARAPRRVAKLCALATSVSLSLFAAAAAAQQPPPAPPPADQPAEDAPTKDEPAKDADAKDEPAKDEPAKDAADKDAAEKDAADKEPGDPTAPPPPEPAAPEPTAPEPTAPEPAAPAPPRDAAAAPPAEAVAAEAADTPMSRRESELRALEQPPIGSEDERPLPDYDGRGDDPVTPGEVLIWIPRGLFYPVYLTTEYVLRWPVGKLVSWLDVNDVPDLVQDFFTFGPGDKSGLVPSGLIDFGFRPSIGVYFFSNDTLWDGSAIRAHFAFGGVGWYRATGTLRHYISEEGVDSYASMVQIKGAYTRRPDWKFFGLGANTFTDEESLYTSQLVDGVVSYDTGFWRSSRVRIDAGVQDARFENTEDSETPGVVDAVAMGFFDLPPLFDEGYLVGYGEVNGAIDTRKRRNVYDGEGSDFVSPPNTGVKLGARAKLVGGLREQNDGRRLGYVKYGGTLGGFVDLYEQRALGLELIVDLVDPLSADGDVPFFDYVSLGGARPLRGFLGNRLLGRSSAVLQLEYTWPIWVWLDGTIHYALGNTFDEHLSDFHTSLLRQSFGGGFQATGARDHTFEMLLAFGTQTFDQGSKLDSIRFVLGSTTGF